MLFHSLVLKLPTTEHSVMFTQSETHSSKKIKAYNIHAHCAVGHISNQLRDMLTLTAAARLNRLTAETCFCRLRQGKQGLGACEKFQILLLWSEALTQSILTSNFHNVTHKSNGFYMYWKEYILWNQADRQKYQAKLVSEPAKLLGAWRRCLHASADSRTGGLRSKPQSQMYFNGYNE